jgi:Zn-dependent protease
VAGIDVFLHPTFLLLLAIVGATSQDGLASVLLTSAVFGCVLLHELGHALTARRFGIRTADITLYPIGGVARLERMPRSPGGELLIALAGPAVNVALALMLIAVRGLAGVWEPYAGGSFLDGFAFSLIAINLGLAAFNMIPAFPMDGGRVLRALLSGWLGRVRATEVAAHLGQALAVIFGVYCLMRVWQGQEQWLFQAFLAGFIYLAARAELARVRAEEYRRREPRDRDGLWFAPPGYAWVSRGPGLWQLAPVTIPVTDRYRPWR